MKILALGAHPDDAEFNCGGTLCKYVEGGHTVTIMHATTGDKGHYVLSPEEASAVRTSESAAAGALIGAKVVCMGFKDGEVFYNEKNLKTFVKLIRKECPDVIITHTPDDYHLDHVAVSKLTTDASFLISVPQVHPQYKHTDKVPQVYFMEPYGGLNFIPSEYVDITGRLEQKCAMMRCHASQIEWLMDHDGMDILDYVVTTAKYRGFQCGVKHAEGFTRYSTALRAVPGRFLP